MTQQQNAATNGGNDDTAAEISNEDKRRQRQIAETVKMESKKTDAENLEESMQKSRESHVPNAPTLYFRDKV